MSKELSYLQGVRSQFEISKRKEYISHQSKVCFAVCVAGFNDVCVCRFTLWRGAVMVADWLVALLIKLLQFGTWSRIDW